MKRIYYFKRYHQVWRISDICNAAGMRVKHEMYKSDMYEPTRSILTNEDFVQAKPDANS